MVDGAAFEFTAWGLKGSEPKTSVGIRVDKLGQLGGACWRSKAACHVVACATQATSMPGPLLTSLAVNRLLAATHGHANQESGPDSPTLLHLCRARLESSITTLKTCRDIEAVAGLLLSRGGKVQRQALAVALTT